MDGGEGGKSALVPGSDLLADVCIECIEAAHFDIQSGVATVQLGLYSGHFVVQTGLVFGIQSLRAFERGIFGGKKPIGIEQACSKCLELEGYTIGRCVTVVGYKQFFDVVSIAHGG